MCVCVIHKTPLFDVYLYNLFLNILIWCVLYAIACMGIVRVHGCFVFWSVCVLLSALACLVFVSSLL